MKLHVDSPFLIIIFLLLSFICAFFTYKRYFGKNKFSKKLVYVLFFLRFFSFFLLCFLLLNPVINFIEKKHQKPKILFFQDNSSSIIASKDSLFYQEQYPDIINAFLGDISKNYQIKCFSFGEEVEEDLNYSFSEKSTNIGSVLSFVEDNFHEENLASVIISSDGIFNTGLDPKYMNYNFNAPLYSILLGDNSIYSDIKISDINYNNIVNLGSDFVVELLINYIDVKESNFTLSVFNNKKLVQKKDIFTKDNGFVKIPLNFKANVAGVNNYTFHISPIKDEKNVSNNIYSIFVNVIESRKKVLLKYDVLNPDINAIVNACYDNPYVELEIVDHKRFKNTDFSLYDIIIFYQIHDMDISYFNLNKPILYFLGSDINNFFGVFKAINSNDIYYDNNIIEGFLNLNKNFKSYKIDQDFIDYLEVLPPLLVSNKDFVLNVNSNVLFNDKYTDKPLWFFFQHDNNKRGIFLGEGIWKWRQYLYRETQNHEIFNILINDILQFLVFSNNNSDLKIDFKSNYYENEDIIIKAQVYNDLFQINNKDDLKLTVKGEGEVFSYFLSKVSDYYKLNLGRFLPGQYSYTIELHKKDDMLYRNGNFTVHPFGLENIDLKANHEFLNYLSKKNNGFSYSLNNIDSLKWQINNFIPPSIEILDKKNLDLIHFKLIFFVILVSLLLEWALRRFNSLK